MAGRKPNSTERFKGGFVRDRGQGPRLAQPKPDELARADSESVQDNALAVRKNNYQGTGQSPTNARKTKLAVLGIPASILDAGSPEYARCVRLAQAYKKARQKELFIAHGYVSSGVSALLAAASLALSASRFLYEVAANPESPMAGGESLPKLLKLASALSDSARQNELSAWELCARERVMNEKNAMNNKAMPWVTSADPAEPKKRGRPRKVEAVASEKPVFTIDPALTEKAEDTSWLRNHSPVEYVDSQEQAIAPPTTDAQVSPSGDVITLIV